MTNEPNLDHLDIMTALKLEADLQALLDKYDVWADNNDTVFTPAFELREKGDWRTTNYIADRLSACITDGARRRAERLEAETGTEAVIDDSESYEVETTEANPIMVTKQLKSSIAFLRVGTIGISRIMDDLDKGEMNESEALHAVEFERKAIDHRIDELEKMVGIAA